jgi:hypothetical protein
MSTIEQIHLLNAMMGQQDTAQRRMFELGKLAISAFRGKRSETPRQRKRQQIMPGSLFIQKSAAPIPVVIAPAVRAAVAAQLMAVPPNDLASITSSVVSLRQ